MILIFDLFETLIDDISLDFNRGLKTFWERHYRERCSFEEIKTYGEELFVHMQEQHKKGLEFAFVKDELPYYAEKFGGEVIPMDAKTEAEFLMRCNEVKVPDGLPNMLDVFRRARIPMYVLSNSGFTAGALRIMLDLNGIAEFFEEIWSSADFGRVKPSPELFGMVLRELSERHPEVALDDILYIGDTYRTDIVGAHTAGLRTVWINRNSEADELGYATYQIREVTQLAALLQSLE